MATFDPCCHVRHILGSNLRSIPVLLEKGPEMDSNSQLDSPDSVSDDWSVSASLESLPSHPRSHSIDRCRFTAKRSCRGH
jgi:hypothetical protein